MNDTAFQRKGGHFAFRAASWLSFLSIISRLFRSNRGSKTDGASARNIAKEPTSAKRRQMWDTRPHAAWTKVFDLS